MSCTRLLVVAMIASGLVLGLGCAAGEGTGGDTSSDTALDAPDGGEGVTDPGWDTADDPPVDGVDTIDEDAAVDTPPDGVDAWDVPPDTADTTGDSFDIVELDVLPDTGPDTGLSECETSGGVCVVASTCTTCSSGMEPSWGERGCGTGYWCCVRASLVDTPCTSAGGVCIPTTSSASCAPGWVPSTIVCSWVESCCVPGPGCP